MTKDNILTRLFKRDKSKEQAAITLAEGAGINGLVIFTPTYTPADALELIEKGDSTVERSATIKGEGAGVYVLNSTIIGNFIGIVTHKDILHFLSKKCSGVPDFY